MWTHDNKAFSYNILEYFGFYKYSNVMTNHYQITLHLTKLRDQLW